MWRLKWFCGLLALLQYVVVFCDQDSCSKKDSCRECISTPNCNWCSGRVDLKGIAEGIHCIHKSRTEKGWCSHGGEIYETTYNETKNEEAFQIHPQAANLNIRIGDEYKLEIKFIKASDFPVDLYYLMDLSNSTADDKKNIAELGRKLAEAMKNFTSDFRLGFGSFVNIVPKKLKEPCEKCAPPYSFHNHLALDKNITKFQDEVTKANVSGNLDFPEVDFNALMQAMVCTKEIKWRKNALHLLVFSTDAPFHIAGDSKLAGILEPNDGKCHMKDNNYIADLQYDYPSIAQIANIASQENINIIFAVTSSHDNIYKQLASQIKGSKQGTIEGNSQNVVQLMTEIFKELTQTMVMTASAPKGVEITYYSKCHDEVLKESDECENVSSGDTITFEARIKVTQCPSEVKNVWKTHIEFSPVGIKEILNMSLEVYCSECENNLMQMPRFRGWVNIPYDGSNATMYQDNRPQQNTLNTSQEANDDSKLIRFFKEEFDINLETDYEKIDVPDFRGGRRGRFIHDFNSNKTGIIDLDNHRCFVMPLNHQSVLPPRSLFDLIKKMWNDYYDVDTEVVRETMRVVTPPISDMKEVGYHISQDCKTYPTYMLEKVEPPAVSKRSIVEDAQFAEFAGKNIVEWNIINLDEVVEYEDKNLQNSA